MIRYTAREVTGITHGMKAYRRSDRGHVMRCSHTMYCLPFHLLQLHPAQPSPAPLNHPHPHPNIHPVPFWLHLPSTLTRQRGQLVREVPYLILINVGDLLVNVLPVEQVAQCSETQQLKKSAGLSLQPAVAFMCILL
jgi:hypothetical protein